MRQRTTIEVEIVKHWWCVAARMKKVAIEDKLEI